MTSAYGMTSNNPSLESSHLKVNLTRGFESLYLSESGGLKLDMPPDLDVLIKLGRMAVIKLSNVALAQYYDDLSRPSKLGWQQYAFSQLERKRGLLCDRVVWAEKASFYDTPSVQKSYRGKLEGSIRSVALTAFSMGDNGKLLYRTACLQLDSEKHGYSKALTIYDPDGFSRHCSEEDDIKIYFPRRFENSIHMPRRVIVGDLSGLKTLAQINGQWDRADIDLSPTESLLIQSVAEGR